jgi:hypothetical protein
MESQESSSSDFATFEKYGYMVVKNAFSKQTASLCRDEIWKYLEVIDGINRNDMSTWPLKSSIDKVWTATDGEPWNNVFTNKLTDAVESLVGEDKIGNFGAGWWKTTFPGYSETPWDADGAWHIDGHGYQHYPFSKEIGLIGIMLFSDINDTCGGTAIAEGSHITAARILYESGLRGCSSAELAHGILNSGMY